MSIKLILAILVSITLMIPIGSFAQDKGLNKENTPDKDKEWSGPPYSERSYIVQKQVLCQSAGMVFQELFRQAEELPFITANNAHLKTITVMVLMDEKAGTLSILELFENGMACVNAFGENIKFFNFEKFEKVLRDGKGATLPNKPTPPGGIKPGTLKQQISVN